MPYKIQNSGSEFCVHKEDANGNIGETVPGGCHPTEAEAKKHMAALYAAMERESKGLLTEEEMELVAKELASKCTYPDQYVPISVKSFAELESWRESEEKVQEIQDKTKDFMALISNILFDTATEDKTSAIKSLADEFSAVMTEESAEDLTEPEEEEEDIESKGTAEDNNLPDSAFLYIEPGGEKDSEGKTAPRSNRHLPYKKANGELDLPRLRNALSRLGQKATGKVGGESWLSASLRKKLQARAKKILANANKSLGDKILDWFSSLLYENKEEKPLPQSNGLMFWKEVNGDWRWFSCYSNNFRDRDNPPEIIAAQSHKGFIEKVDKGLVAYPELWLWHRPEYKFGTADWVAYDEIQDGSGFALASGSIDKGCEPIAEQLSKIKSKSIRVSHGMPIKSIVRDPDDPTVIIEHVTVEISPLPAEAAANMLTSFSILKEEQTMPIPTDKKQTLIEEWGIPADILEKLEAQNAEMAKEAKAAGIQSKETGEPTPPIATSETQVTDVPSVTDPVSTKEETVETPATPTLTPTLQEIAEAVSSVLNPQLTAINQQFEALEAKIASMQSEMKSLKESDEVKVAEKAAKTPAASLSALLAGSIRSVIGAPETRVDGRVELAKSKPQEAKNPPAYNSPNLGIFVVDQIIGDSEKPKTS